MPPCVSSLSPVVAPLVWRWLVLSGWVRRQQVATTSPRNEISLSARGGEENETNNHEPPMRTTRTRLRLVSTCAPTQRKSARCARSKVSSRSTRPSRPTSFRAHNHEWKRATGVRDTSSNAGRRARVLSFVPAGSAPLRAPGRVSSYRTSLSAALSLPSRATEAPPVRKRAALSDLLGYRTSFAREGQHPKVSATRK